MIRPKLSRLVACQRRVQLGVGQLGGDHPDMAGADQQRGVLCWPPFTNVTNCAAARSRLVREGLSDPAGLRGVPWFGFSGPANEPYIRLVARQLAANALDDADVTGIDSLTAQKRLIEADFGVGMLPASSVEEELRLGSLQRLHLPTLETQAPVMLIHRSTPLSTAAALLVQALTAAVSARKRC